MRVIMGVTRLVLRAPLEADGAMWPVKLSMLVRRNRGGCITYLLTNHYSNKSQIYK